jgi:hypothetical protein
VEPYDGPSSSEFDGTVDPIVPRSPRDIPAGELVLRDFDPGYYQMKPTPGDSTDEEMGDIIERRVLPPTLQELTEFQTNVSDMFQRCCNDERDLTRILGVRARRRCNDLQRARDENQYILARQHVMLQRIQELTREQDEACNNIAIQSDELSHLRQEVCMRNVAIIELRRKLAFQERRTPGSRVDTISTSPRPG